MNNNFTKVIKKWFSSIDRVTFLTAVAIIAIGICVCIASTPGVALKLGVSPFYFVKHHVLTIPIGLLLMIFVSFLNVKHIRKFALFCYFICLLLVLLTIILGTEIKGAKRWLNIVGFSLQPSEFFKPILAITTAWLISEQYRDKSFPGIFLSFLSIAFVAPFLIIQPDVGMSFVITSTWISQLFISGLSIQMIVTFFVFLIGALICMYFTLPHFSERINKFFAAGNEDIDLYQIKKSIEAFKNGGLFGKGPGEGTIKTQLPDSHSDFVFSVIGEEFGLIVCIIIVGLFLLLTIRPLLKTTQMSDIFSLCAVFGIVFQIILQVTINISTSLNLIPTKGMTMPFLSYGGSSFLSSAIGIGVILALTKKQY